MNCKSFEHTHKHETDGFKFLFIVEILFDNISDIINLIYKSMYIIDDNQKQSLYLPGLS